MSGVVRDGPGHVRIGVERRIREDFAPPEIGPGPIGPDPRRDVPESARPALNEAIEAFRFGSGHRAAHDQLVLLRHALGWDSDLPEPFTSEIYARTP